MHGVDFLQDLAVVMIVAGLVTVVFNHFKQPVVLGYILAGVIIGPNTPPFPLIHDEDTIQTLAELGVIFLMFSLGLEFSLRKLKAVGATAIIGASLEILLMVFVGYEVGRAFGWSKMDSIFLGAMLSISSTTIIIKALAELGKSKEKFASLIFGILIVEDILAIVMIALLSGIAMTGTLTAGAVGETVGRLSVFLVTTLVLGLIFVPKLIRYVAGFKRNEMLLITVLALCFGISLLAVKLGYSVALGAFIIGAVIAESREIGKIESLMEPIRDMFSAVFFVTIGLLIEPKMLMDHAAAIAIITVAVVVGKVITCSLGTFMAGHNTRTSLKVGMGLAQIGEFSFIIASLGLTLKVTSDFLYPIAVTVSAITTLITPYLIRSSDSIAALFDRYAPKTLVNSLEIYTRWTGQLGQRSGRNSMAARFIRKWLLQVLLNIILMAAIFIGAVFLSNYPPIWLPQERRDYILWLAAAVLCLPLYIASFRKLQAFGMLLADMRISRDLPQSRRAVAQSIISQIIAVAGSAFIALLLMLVSSILLPPLNVLLVLLFVLALIAWLMWRKFVKVYSSAQVALMENLAEKPAPHSAHGHEEEAPARLPSILKHARLKSVLVGENSPAARRFIRELQLRSATGASIVGIQRNGDSIVNPGADEEIAPGDEVLLLGNDQQLDAAKNLLEGTS